MTDQERLQALYAELLLERFGPLPTRPPFRPPDAPLQQSIRRQILHDAVTPDPDEEE